MKSDSIGIESLGEVIHGQQIAQLGCEQLVQLQQAKAPARVRCDERVARGGELAEVFLHQLGGVFAHDIRAAGVAFTTDVRPGQPTTARCLIFVTPDGQRTMNTHLGACTELVAEDIDDAVIASSRVMYIEGYQWDTPDAKAAIRKATKAAKAASVL